MCIYAECNNTGVLFVPRALTKFFFHTFTSNEALEMMTNILEETKSTTLNDLQVSLYLYVCCRCVCLCHCVSV